MDFFVVTPSIPLDIKSLSDILNRPGTVIEHYVLDSHTEQYSIHTKNHAIICEYLKHKYGPSLNEHTIAIRFKSVKNRNQMQNLKDLCTPASKQELCDFTKKIEEAYKSRLQDNKQH